MNTSTITELDIAIQSASATTTTGRSRRRRSRLVGLALAAITAASLAVTVAPQTSEAASGATACFKTRTGLVVAPVSTRLELYMNGSWRSVASSTNNRSTGCITYTMTGSYRSYYARIRMAGYAATGDYFSATSPLMALPGSAAPFLGTAYVSCIGYCYGV